MPQIDETAYHRQLTPTERELSTPTLDERLLDQQHHKQTGAGRLFGATQNLPTPQVSERLLFETLLLSEGGCMTRPDVTTPLKRLHILDDEEIEALYGRPCLTGDERTDVFTLTQPEKDLLASFTHIPIQLYFLLQLGYFKTKQLFFTFAFDDVVEDVTYLLEDSVPRYV